MEFVELIVQGIGPFPKPHKLGFGPGYNLILGGNETGKTLIYQLVTAVLDPGRFSAVQAAVPVEENGEVPPRAGIRFRVPDREYRVIRDFKTGDLVIHQLDKETQEWKVLDRSPEAWKKLWKKETGISASDYLQLFALDRFEPTRAPEPRPGRVQGKKPAAAAPSTSPAKNQGEQEEKLKTLKADLARAEEIERIEFELDGLHSQVFQIEEKNKGIPGIEDRIREAEDKIRKYPGYADLPPDIETKIESFKKLNTQKTDELNKLEEERKQVEAEMEVLLHFPEFYREPIFIAGAVVAFLALISAIAFSGRIPSWSTAPFLFGGAGASFYTLWKFWARKEKLAGIKKQIADWDEKARVIEKRFEIEGNFVRRLQEKTGAILPTEILEKRKEYRAAAEEKKRLEQEKADYLARINLPEMEAQRKQLKAEIEQRQKQLLEMGAVAMDPLEMRREIKRIESRLGMAEPGEGIEAVEDLGGGSEDLESFPDREEQPEAGGGGNWELIREILNVSDESEVREKVVEGSSQALGALTHGRYQLVLDPGSEQGFKIVSTANRRAVAARTLPLSARETVAASWQLTVWKALCSRFSLPIILDDPFRNFDPARLAFLAQNLKKISTRAQVIHFSFNTALTKIADQTVMLGK